MLVTFSIFKGGLIIVAVLSDKAGVGADLIQSYVVASADTLWRPDL